MIKSLVVTVAYWMLNKAIGTPKVGDLVTVKRHTYCDNCRDGSYVGDCLKVVDIAYPAIYLVQVESSGLGMNFKLDLQRCELLPWGMKEPKALYEAAKAGREVTI